MFLKSPLGNKHIQKQYETRFAGFISFIGESKKLNSFILLLEKKFASSYGLTSSVEKVTDDEISK